MLLAVMCPVLGLSPACKLLQDVWAAGRVWVKVKARRQMILSPFAHLYCKHDLYQPSVAMALIS